MSLHILKALNKVSLRHSLHHSEFQALLIVTKALILLLRIHNTEHFNEAFNGTFTFLMS